MHGRSGSRHRARLGRRGGRRVAAEVEDLRFALCQVQQQQADPAESAHVRFNGGQGRGAGAGHEGVAGGEPAQEGVDVHGAEQRLDTQVLALDHQFGDDIAREALRLAAMKLPIKTRTVVREDW